MGWGFCMEIAMKIDDFKQAQQLLAHRNLLRGMIKHLKEGDADIVEHRGLPHIVIRVGESRAPVPTASLLGILDISLHDIEKALTALGLELE